MKVTGHADMLSYFLPSRQFNMQSGVAIYCGGFPDDGNTTQNKDHYELSCALFSVYSMHFYCWRNAKYRGHID